MTIKTEDSINEKIKKRIVDILNINTRVPAKKKEMDNGDVSPFLIEIFGEKMMLASKVAQSIQTTFGMSFYEQVCKELGEEAGYEVELQYKLIGHLDQAVNDYLHSLLETTEYKPNRVKELAKIKTLSGNGAPVEFPDSTVDIYIKKPSGEEYFIDITTVKPNKKEFRTLKRKLLTWAALRYSQDKSANVNPLIAIPYNPEATKDITNTVYNRHNSYYDRSDILVGDELWKLASGNLMNIETLQKIFVDVGVDTQKTIEKALS